MPLSDFTATLACEGFGKTTIAEGYTMIYEVVENGPDSTDYVVATFRDTPRKDYDSFYRSAEERANTVAANLTENNAYLGYGYTVRRVAD